jgi:hypothetical protein
VYLPWLLYIDDLVIFAHNAAMMETIATLVFQAFHSVGLVLAWPKVKWVASKYLVRREINIMGRNLAAQPLGTSVKVLGLQVTAEGHLPNMEQAKRSRLNWHLQSVLRPVRGLLPVDALARRIGLRLSGVLAWALHLLPPSKAAARRWQGLQHRLFARLWRSAPQMAESTSDFARRRCREAKQHVQRLGLQPWGRLHVVAYYRAAQRIATSSAESLLFQLFYHNSRWQQRTLSFLDGGRSSNRRPGCPSRWDDSIGRYFEQYHHADWLQSPGLFSPADEQRFVDWILPPPSDLLEWPLEPVRASRCAPHVQCCLYALVRSSCLVHRTVV